MLTSQLALGATSAVAVLLYVALFVVAWRRRPWPQGVAATALGVATVGLVLRLPYQAISLLTLDPAPMFDDVSPAMVAVMSKRVVSVAWVSATVTVALTWLAHVAAGAVAVTERPDRPAYPWVLEPAALSWATAAGVALGGVLLLTQPEPDLTLHPDLVRSTGQRVAWGLSRGLGAAVGSELLWRGVVQGALVRRMGAKAGIVAAAVLAGVPALVGPEAAMQAPVALVMAGCFGTIAYRHSLSSSTLAHAVAAMLAAAPLALEAA